MQVAIFTEAGAKFGRGHLSRCEALMQGFESCGANVKLFVNENGVNYEDIKANINGADVVVIDSYVAPLKCYTLAAKTAKLGVWFDDYNRLTYPKGYVISGKTILRKAFLNTPHRPNGKIFVSFGGTDNAANIEKITTKLKQQFSDKQIVTPCNLDETQTATLMSECDFAISAAGQTLLELCAIGVPSVALVIADNQTQNAANLLKHGHILASFNIKDKNWANKAVNALKQKTVAKILPDTKKIAFDILRIAKLPSFRQDLQIDGLALKNFANLSKAEALRVLEWRNSLNIRKWMLNSDIIPQEQHFAFLKSRKTDERSFYWLVKQNNIDIGVVSIARIDWQNRIGFGGWYASPASNVQGSGIIFDRLCIDIAFNLLGLRKLIMEVAASNKTPLAVHKFSGFEQEGRLNGYFENGDDLILLGLLNDTQ